MAFPSLSKFLLLIVGLLLLVRADNGATLTSGTLKGSTAAKASSPIGLQEVTSAPTAGSGSAVPTVNVETGTSASSPSSTGTSAAATGVATVNSTILVLARDSDAAFQGYSMLRAYAIPYEVVIVPSAGAQLPALSSSASQGNYGGIITLSELSYEYGSDWRSALTQDQWNNIYTYQEAFNVRLVRLDVTPSAQFGVEEADGGGVGTDQPVYISDDSAFPQALLKTGPAANMSTLGIFHSPANLVDTMSANFTTKEIAKFGATGQYQESTAAIINDFGNRQQMVWFMPWASDWSGTSVFLSHAWVQWVTRGLYLGFRRQYFSTQIDDMFLETDMYIPVNSTYRIDPDSIGEHIPWMASINSRLPAGSFYRLETGHNGNGNIEEAVDINDDQRRPTTCDPDGGIEYAEQIDTPLEFYKPLGTGTDIWPDNITEYDWSLECSQLDKLLQFWQNDTNFNAFYHISHTFTHEDEDNATYSDVVKEIQWNQQWLDTVGFSDSDNFSPNGIIPPAITGLHNGDALRAWLENGIKWVVGDNTRPPLMNQENPHWPLITNVKDNGYDGVYIIGRWATTIYYNCDLPNCTVQEWVDTSAGTNSFDALLEDAKRVNTWHLLGLHWDPFMFHQANLRVSDVPPTTINNLTARHSLLQSWVETVLTEMLRLVTWPFLTLKHDDLCQAWIARMTRDACVPSMSYTLSADRKTVTGWTVDAADQSCAESLPVTVPGDVVDADGVVGKREQVGGDELTVWVDLGGQARTLDFVQPVVL